MVVRTAVAFSINSSVVASSSAGYVDFSCSPCRWGDYSGMTPDPRPTISGSGEVWGTNQFSGVLNPPTTIASWRTEIFALKP